MSPRSLRLRLFAGGSLAIAVALGLAWIAMTLLFERHIERRLADDLAREAVPLIAGLRLDPGNAPQADTPPPDPRFELPSSGLYWQLDARGGVARSRSLWDSALPVLTAPGTRWQPRTIDGPFGRPLLVIARAVRPDRNGGAVTVQLAGDVDALHAARDEFGRELALFLLLLGGALAAAAWIQVTLGLRPLRMLEAAVGQLRRDPAARMTGRWPSEVAPLTHAIDALADTREADLIRARHRAADLAHGMKTPLAALTAQSSAARRSGADAAADGLDLAIAALSDAIEGELRRARVAVALAGPGGRTPLAGPIERVVQVLEQTEAGERVAFALDVASDATAPLREEELTELVGALIDNAARHARRLVRVVATEGLIAVSDDGPGIDKARLAEARVRGRRLDEAGPGHGLGLAIVHELAEASRGEVRLERADLGGLSVEVRWSDAA